MKYVYSLLLFVLLVFVASCQKPLRTRAEMQAYLADPSHGLMRVRQDSVLKVTAYVVPPALQAKQSPDDSATYAQNGGLTMVIKLESLVPTEQDFLIEAAGSYEAYAQAVEELSFSPGKFLSLKLADGSEIVPALSTLETAFEHNPAKRLYLVFPSKNAEGRDLSGKVTLVFKDFFEGQPTYQFDFDLAEIATFEKLSHV